ncbi:MAG: GIY-YIG nuclease family protein [Bacteroidaceae bacterium]|nr:GIY-YIG nuclease family protein [Bacteroidaceae bacterium]
MLPSIQSRFKWCRKYRSSVSVEQRVKQLDSTGVPLPFEIYATMRTAKYQEAEKLIHNFIYMFTNLRIRDNREFFNVKPE